MLTYQEVEPRVRRGVELLDRVRPEWWKEIDIKELSMPESCNCILGQLWECFGLGTEKLWPGSVHRQQCEAEYHAFMARDDDYPLIEQTWRSWITSRRQAAAKPDFNPEDFKR